MTSPSRNRSTPERIERSPALPRPEGRGGLDRAGWVLLAFLGVALWLPALSSLCDTWRNDETLSYGPGVLSLAVGHLWLRRKALRRRNADSRQASSPLVAAVLIYIAASWADIVILKDLSLIAMTLFTVRGLCGRRAFQAAAGALGFLAFAIPWPTSLSDRIAFPLQLTSSAYAGLFGGMLGLPIHREGVQLFVMSDSGKPIYSILVAQQCSGLRSLMVLLALGYLVAYHTPVGPAMRAVLVACVVPLALFANTVRLTVILLFGTYFDPATAKWVHDHEAPVLIFVCSLGLIGMRQAALAWARAARHAAVDEAGGKAVVHAPASGY